MPVAPASMPPFPVADSALHLRIGGRHLEARAGEARLTGGYRGHAGIEPGGSALARCERIHLTLPVRRVEAPGKLHLWILVTHLHVQGHVAGHAPRLCRDSDRLRGFLLGRCDLPLSDAHRSSAFLIAPGLGHDAQGACTHRVEGDTLESVAATSVLAVRSQSDLLPLPRFVPVLQYPAAGRDHARVRLIRAVAV